MSAHGRPQTFRWRSLLADAALFTSALSAAGVASAYVAVQWVHAPDWASVLSAFAVQGLTCWWWLARVWPPGLWGERTS